jgi:hypothetical protein
LERRKNYPVRMKAGAASWNTDVAAESAALAPARSDHSKRICTYVCRSLFQNGGNQRASGPFLAERVGFEPTVRLPRTGCQNPCSSGLPTSGVIYSHWGPRQAKRLARIFGLIMPPEPLTRTRYPGPRHANIAVNGTGADARLATMCKRVVRSTSDLDLLS